MAALCVIHQKHYINARDTPKCGKAVSNGLPDRFTNSGVLRCFHHKMQPAADNKQQDSRNDEPENCPSDSCRQCAFLFGIHLSPVYGAKGAPLCASVYHDIPRAVNMRRRIPSPVFCHAGPGSRQDFSALRGDMPPEKTKRGTGHHAPPPQTLRTFNAFSSEALLALRTYHRERRTPLPLSRVF